MDEAEKRLPESGVPNGILHGAVEMDTLQYFEPKLGGPATHGTPFSADQEQSKADDDVEEYPDEVEDKETHRDPACFRAADALIAEENANAEFLIGLDGSPDDDAVAKLAAYRSKVQLADDLQKRIKAAEVRAQQAGDSESGVTTTMESAGDVAALLADHKNVCIDMRTMARTMGDRFEQEIEESVSAAHKQSSPATLRIRTGAPLSLFDPAAWVACLAQFLLR